MLLKFQILKGPNGPKSFNKINGILSKNQLYRPFTSSPNNPNELVNKMRSLLNNSNGSDKELITQMNQLLKNEQNNQIIEKCNINSPNNSILSDIGAALGAGLVASLYLIALAGAFAGMFYFVDDNPFVAFVCFVLFMTLLLPALA